MKKIVCLFVCLFVGSANAAIVSVGNFVNNGGGTYTLTNSGVSSSIVETFVGVPSGTLNSISTGAATNGSAFKDTVSIFSGNTFSFNWLWNSGEFLNSSYNDFSFVNLSLGGITVLADAAIPANTSGTFSWTATTSGILTYGIGVMNVNDQIVPSSIAISNINISGSNIPEPTSIVLLSLGLVGLGFSRKKKAA